MNVKFIFPMLCTGMCNWQNEHVVSANERAKNTLVAKHSSHLMLIALNKNTHQSIIPFHIMTQENVNNTIQD